MKDPTRGGLANTLNEWAQKSKVLIEINEVSIPIKEPVIAACEMLLESEAVMKDAELILAILYERKFKDGKSKTDKKS